MSDRRRHRIVLWGAVLAAGIALSCEAALADSTRLRVDLQTLQSSTTVSDKTTGETFESEASRTSQQYDFTLSKNLYPNLVLLGGGLYEQTNTATSSAGQEFESEETLLRPFARVSVNTPIYRAGVEYNHTTIANDSTGSETSRRYQDNFNTILGWNPEGLPEFTLRYDQNSRRDDADTIDTQDRKWNLESSHSPLEGMQLFYAFRQEEAENRISGSRTTRDNHNGRIDYAHGFLENRLNMATGYQIFYTRQVSQSASSVEREIVPAAGLFSIDDTPGDGPALAVNNTLIDGILGASTGIDIGLGGDETTLTNIGIDLGLPTAVDRLRLWVDRPLTAAVADSFSWDIYTSPDNLNTSTWTLAASVAPAPFGAFENRFEIEFSEVTTRFIKVVVRPLLPAVTGAISFPNIFVTEIEPFSTAVPTEAETELETVDQNYNFNLTGRLSDNTTVGYDLFYRQRRQDRVSGPEENQSSELANGVFLRHTFNPVFSGNARLQVTDTENNQEKTVGTDYSASVRADYLDTFNQIFTYSGSRTDVEQGNSTSHSFFLRSNLDLYRGWSAFIDTGYSLDETASSVRTDTTTMRVGTSVAPHRKVTVNLDYQWRQTGSADTEGPGRTDTDYNVQVFYVPFPALSFFGKYTLRERLDQRRTLQNYAVNWSPFPDGTLQCSVAFNETMAPEEDRFTRNYGPFVKWSISRYLSVETQYSVNVSDSPTQKVDSRTLQAKLTFIW